MKFSILLALMLFWMNSIAQDGPSINLSTTKLIQGFSNRYDTIKVSIDTDFKEEFSKVITDKDGNFKISYPVDLLATVKSVIVWKVDKDGNHSEPMAVPVLSSAEAIEALTKPVTNPFLKKRITGNVHSYKATILNTNFSIPLARFNFSSGEDSKKGNILLFNSIGAGFGISWGEMTEIKDDSNKVLNQSFKNTFAIHAGVLFSAGTGEEDKNVFAPIINFSALDFQLGLGYELGTISEHQKRPFVTVSYSIPLYKLTNTGFYIWKSDNGNGATFSKGN